MALPASVTDAPPAVNRHDPYLLHRRLQHRLLQRRLLQQRILQQRILQQRLSLRRCPPIQAIRCAGPVWPPRGRRREAYTTRSIIIFLISAIALAGFRPLGQTCAQFMMVWQR